MKLLVRPCSQHFARARLLKANGDWLPEKAFRYRKLFYNKKDVGFFNNVPPQKSAMEAMANQGGRCEYCFTCSVFPPSKCYDVYSLWTSIEIGACLFCTHTVDSTTVGVLQCVV